MNLLYRILVSIVMIPIVLYAAYAGGYYFLGFIGLMSFLGFWEFKKIASEKTEYIIPWKYLFWFPVLISVLTHFFGMNILVWGLVVYSFLIGFILIYNSQVENSVNIVGNEVLIYLYTIILPNLILILRNSEILGNTTAYQVIIMIMLLTWTGDTAAYFGGVGIKWKKKHKLSPVVSPNKSWEGAVCEFVFTIIFAVVLSYFLKFNITVYFAAAIGFIVSTAGQTGDLIESLFKRDAGVKDSSNIIPGHGGVLDRFDSYIYNCAFTLLLIHISEFFNFSSILFIK